MVSRLLIAERRRLVVLDAHAHAHRAYHALDPMHAPDGLPTNALYGFAGLLRRVVIDDRPDYLAVVFDAPDDRRTTFRSALYPAYKGNRPPKPPDLAAQIPLLRDIARAFNAPVLEDEGFEADDLIASVVALAEAADIRTLVQSGDKDLLQLASPRTTLWDAMRGRHYAPAAVEEKLGVPPAAVADYLALVGDASDNVPGVPGVGPKTASALLRAWGSLDGIYAALETLPPRERLRLETHREVAYLSRALTRLRADVPLGLELEALALQPPDHDAVATLFARFGFYSLIPPRRSRAHFADQLEPIRAERAAPLASPAAAPVEQVADGPGWTGALTAIDRSPLIALALGPRSLGVATLAGAAFEIALDVPLTAQRSLFDAPSGLSPDAVFQALARVLAAPGRAVIAADALTLSRKVPLGRVDFDPVLARRLLGPGPEPAATQDDTAGQGDVARTALRERSSLLQSIDQAGLGRLYREVELPLVPVLRAIEQAGLPIDRAAVETARGHCDAERKALEAEIHQLAGRRFRIDDARALGEILFGVLGLPTMRRGRTRASVDALALGELARAHPLPRAVLALQRSKRLEKDCLRPLAHSAERKTRLAATFENLGPSGRCTPDGPLTAWLDAMRTGSPNDRVRLGAIVPADHLLAVDVAQLDLRLAAHLSHDASLVAACACDDPHLTLAAELYGEAKGEVDHHARTVAKSLALGLLYGTSAAQVAQHGGIAVREAKKLIAARDLRHERLRAWQDELVRAARSAGRARSMLGRIRALPELADERPAIQKLGEGLAMTAVVAGSAADVMKLVLVRLSRDLAGLGRIVAVADDLVVVEHEAALFAEASARARATVAALADELALSVPLVARTTGLHDHLGARAARASP